MSAIYDGGVFLTKCIRVTRQKEQKKIVTTLLDGSEHVQVIGLPTLRLEVEFVVSEEGRNVIDNCDSTGALLQINDDEGDIHYGRILQKDPWEKLPHGWFKTTIIVSVEVV